jgi:hypothetical protein
MAMTMKKVVFWDLAPCSSHLLTLFSSRFTCPEDGGDTFLRNVGSNQDTRRQIPEDDFLQYLVLFTKYVMYVCTLLKKRKTNK